MPETMFAGISATARTIALQRVLSKLHDDTVSADLLFLERWEMEPLPGAAAALRVVQIRRANPALAAEIRAEISRGRPLTALERDSLLEPKQV
jgi:hypothetical protein